MKLFKKTPKKIPDQHRIEELEIELGFTPVVTEENFEREFDRAVIEDYREKHGNEWSKLYRQAHIKYRGYDHKVYMKYDKAEKRAKEVSEILMLEESKKAFEEEFDPYRNGTAY